MMKSYITSMRTVGRIAIVVLMAVQLLVLPDINETL